MSTSITRQIKNYIEYNNKPFTSKIISDSMGFKLSQVSKVISALHNRNAITILGKEGRLNIYQKNPDYVEEPLVNRFGFKYKILKKIYNTISNRRINSISKLRDITGHEKGALLKYVTALASENIVIIESGLYKIINKKPNLHMVGRNMEEGILTKLRENDRR